MRTYVISLLVMLLIAVPGCKQDDAPKKNATKKAEAAKRAAPVPGAVSDKAEATEEEPAPAKGEVAASARRGPASIDLGDKAKAESAESAPDDTVEFALVTTNDVHGYILPRRTYLSPDQTSPEGYVVELGGVEWLAGYLDIIHRKFGGRVILADGGDMFQGTMISNRFEGATVVEAMNKLKYLAAAVGNHEFDFGPVGEGEDPTKDPFGAIRARAAQAKFPFLAANLIDRSTGKMVEWENVASHFIVEVEGIKVGFVGGTTVTTPSISKPRVGESIDFIPLAPVFRRVAPELRKQGARIIIGVVHAGGSCEEFGDPNDLSTCDPSEELFDLARGLEPGTVDALVGGHTHRVIAHFVNGTPIIEAASNGRMFSFTRLTFSRTLNRVTKVQLQRPVGVCHYFFKPHGDCVFLDKLPGEETEPATFLGEQVKPVKFLDALFTDEQRQVLAEASENLGPVAVANLSKVDPGNQDHPMGMLLTHVLLQHYPEAQIALFNESGLRAGIVAGNITMEDVFQVLPFDSGPAFVKLSGKRLLDLLRVASSGAHGLPVVRGLRLVVDRKKDECIAEDWNQDGKKEDWERNLLVSADTQEGTPIDPSAEYTIITSSYLAMGGSDFSKVLSQKDTWLPEDSRPVRDLVIEWMRANPVNLGGDDDWYTKHGRGPLVKILHPDHEVGSSCGEGTPAAGGYQR